MPAFNSARPQPRLPFPSIRWGRRAADRDPERTAAAPGSAPAQRHAVSLVQMRSPLRGTHASARVDDMLRLDAVVGEHARCVCGSTRSPVNTRSPRRLGARRCCGWCSSLQGAQLELPDVVALCCSPTSPPQHSRPQLLRSRACVTGGAAQHRVGGHQAERAGRRREALRSRSSPEKFLPARTAGCRPGCC